MSHPLRVLRIDASARRDDSVTRRLGDLLLERLAQSRELEVTARDVAQGLPFVHGDWVAANFTDPGERTEAQRETLALSDALVAELRAADVVVLGAPVYNFGIPASLKAWIDLVARARETFRYTPEGPVGLLEGRKAYVLVATGGTQVGSDIDFATPYLRHVLGFLGIHDVEIVAVDRLTARGDDAVDEAADAITRLPLDLAPTA